LAVISQQVVDRGGQLVIGKTISHYKILEKLGEGGMGVVYKAEDTKLRRVVALKFLTPQSLGDATERARFIHEAQAAAALNHPNICTVHEIDEADGETFIAMEYVEGQSLKEKIQSGPMDLDEAIGLAAQMAEGLQKAHEKGIVHRDVKPANVMITEGGQAKIMDFGLAKSGERSALTKTGTTLGTVGYMSPEQARGEDLDGKSDIWSLGVVLYEMVSGLLPFKGDYEPAVVFSILNEEPEPLTALRTGVAMELERMVNKALAKSPDERYQHAEDLIVDLRRLVKAEPSKATRAGAAERRRSRRLVLYSGITVLPILLIAIIYSVFLRHDSGDLKAPIDSIAVLPLDNLSGDPAEEYFVQGMHEGLITDLSRLGALRVISRTSVMRYKDAGKPIPEIAKELDVDAVVEGSVLRVGDRVRITAQLIRGDSDEHMWADSYDREMRDVLSVISEVARSIAGEIEVAVSEADELELTDSRPVEPEAYDAYLMGQFHFNTLSPREFPAALEYFEKARDIDPGFAEAYAAEGGIYFLYAHFGMKPRNEVIGPARAAVEKALQLDKDLPGAHAIKGCITLYIDWDWPAAERELKLALKGDPGDAMIRHAYADYLMVMGRHQESLEQVLIGRKYDPSSPMGLVPVFGHLQIAGRYDESIEECRRILRVDPEFPVARHFLGEGLWSKGMYDEAVREFRMDLEGNEELVEALDSGYADSGPMGAMLAVAELRAEWARAGRGRALTVAGCFAKAGEADSTLFWLEKGYEARETQLLHITAQPQYDFVRGDPRFQDILRRIGLPQGGPRSEDETR
jgi:serine/threonine protein kinase/tetratricopeptide (TPR) repeat protein